MIPSGIDSAALVGIRRLLHKHAELAFTEVFTSAMIRRVVDGLAADHEGIRVLAGKTAMDVSAVVNYPSAETMAAAADRAVALGVDAELARWIAEHGTAVVVDIEGSRPGELLGMRFDFDGLPITESASESHLPRREGFACDDGTMHACGHDGHTAIGLVLARRLAADRDFAGTVRLVFQPAEESVRGGAAMVAAGVGLGIDSFIGLHLGEGLPAGVIAASAAHLQATRKYEVNFTGRAAHSAGSPQEGRNAIGALATSVLGLLGTARDSRGQTTVNVGKIEGGAATNIIAEHAWLNAEVRSDVTEVCDDLFARAEATVAGAGEMWGVQTELTVVSQCPTFTADDAIIDRALAATEGLAGVHDIRRAANMNASDDLAVWALETQRQGGQATFLIVGASSPAPHHNPEFDIDERVLSPACDWLEKIVRGR